MVATAVRSRCESEQAEALAKAMKWEEERDVRVLFRRVDELERMSDSALGIERGEEIAKIVSRAVDELLAHAETIRDSVIDETVKSVEFVGDEDEPGVGWHGKDAEEQALDFDEELRRDMPTVDDLAKRARRGEFEDAE